MAKLENYTKYKRKIYGKIEKCNGKKVAKLKNMKNFIKKLMMID